MIWPGSSSVRGAVRQAVERRDRGRTGPGIHGGGAMPLIRAFVTAFLALAALLEPLAAGAQTPDPPTILVPSEEIQARGIKVLAALLVALTANAQQGPVVPHERIAEAERLLAGKLAQEARRRAPLVPSEPLRRIADTAPVGHENAATRAKSYKNFHTFAAPVTIMSPPITDAFAAPCDSKQIGWPRAQATEMLGVDCARVAPWGERLKLSDGLHRRRSDSLRDVILGQNAPPSPDRMNLDGISRTYVPALFIAKW